MRASVYSEKRGKLVRAEGENAESAEGVARSAPGGLGGNHFAASTTRCEISSTPTTAVQALYSGWRV